MGWEEDQRRRKLLGKKRNDRTFSSTPEQFPPTLNTATESTNNNPAARRASNTPSVSQERKLKDSSTLKNQTQQRLSQAEIFERAKANLAIHCFQGESSSEKIEGKPKAPLRKTPPHKVNKSDEFNPFGAKSDDSNPSDPKFGLTYSMFGSRGDDDGDDSESHSDDNINGAPLKKRLKTSTMGKKTLTLNGRKQTWISGNALGALSSDSDDDNENLRIAQQLAASRASKKSSDDRIPSSPSKNPSDVENDEEIDFEVYNQYKKEQAQSRQNKPNKSSSGHMTSLRLQRIKSKAVPIEAVSSRMDKMSKWKKKVDEPPNREGYNNTSAQKKRRKMEDSLFNAIGDKDDGEEDEISTDNFSEPDTSTQSQSQVFTQTSDPDGLHPELDNVLLPVSELTPFILKKDYAVPAAMNRYLQAFQREGIQFLFEHFSSGRGCILGDDMGLGKTCQSIGLLLALMEKSGTNRDQDKIFDNQEAVLEILKEERRAVDNIYYGNNEHNPDSQDGRKNKTVKRSRHSPVLVISPASVVKNWMRELRQWGHFAAYSIETGAQDQRAEIFENFRLGLAEVLVISNSLFSKKEIFVSLMQIEWNLIIVDEFHEYKNDKTSKHRSVKELSVKRKIPVIGLTGTAFQNDIIEVFNLAEICQPGKLGEKKQFEVYFSRTIKQGAKKNATTKAKELGAKRQEELHLLLKGITLSRKKSDFKEILDLKSKTENAIFCELSPLQKRMYTHMLTLPEYDIQIRKNQPCDCGINNKFFETIRKMEEESDKRAIKRYIKEHPPMERKDCCYHSLAGVEGNHPMFKKQHPNGTECQRCPSCLIFPAMSKLSKICCHPSLLQARFDPDHPPNDATPADIQKVKEDYDFAVEAIPLDLLKFMPGEGYVRQNAISDDHLALSGKLEMLQKLLDRFNRERSAKTLVFSYSTQTLDIIENYIKSTGKYTGRYSRLDGSTQSSKRTNIVDRFQNDAEQKIFLISTKAGGMGLNLTAANKVIIFDVNWNPSYDEQAQDRAYRLGQSRKVTVFRLICQGTIEEKMYMRQIYKVHLRARHMGDGQGKSSNRNENGNDFHNDDEFDDEDVVEKVLPRLFYGIKGDKYNKGELFGAQNLLCFDEGGLMCKIMGELPTEGLTNESIAEKMKTRASALLAETDDGDDIKDILEGSTVGLNQSNLMKKIPEIKRDPHSADDEDETDTQEGISVTNFSSITYFNQEMSEGNFGSIPMGQPSQTPKEESIPMGQPSQTPREESIPMGQPSQTPKEESIPMGQPSQTSSELPSSSSSLGVPIPFLTKKAAIDAEKQRIALGAQKPDNKKKVVEAGVKANSAATADEDKKSKGNINIFGGAVSIIRDVSKGGGEVAADSDDGALGGGGGEFSIFVPTYGKKKKKKKAK